MIPVLFHPDAETELDYSIDFYEERQSGLGIRFMDDVLYAVSQIQEAPKRWRLHKHGIRRYQYKTIPLPKSSILNFWIIYG